MIASLPAELRVVPMLPWWIERALLLLACLWFVNLTNFMDGIDWMTVAEFVPVTLGLALRRVARRAPAAASSSALALFGGLLGFAPFNRPVARLFLGDVGSLPIGLLLAWLLLLLAGRGHLAAALILPLYYLADATLTLLPARREPRAVLAGASHAFLSARHRPRLQRVRDRGARVPHQCRAGGARDASVPWPGPLGAAAGALALRRPSGRLAAAGVRAGQI